MADKVLVGFTQRQPDVQRTYELETNESAGLACSCFVECGRRGARKASPHLRRKVLPPTRGQGRWASATTKVCVRCLRQIGAKRCLKQSSPVLFHPSTRMSHLLLRHVERTSINNGLCEEAVRGQSSCPSTQSLTLRVNYPETLTQAIITHLRVRRSDLHRIVGLPNKRTSEGETRVRCRAHGNTKECRAKSCVTVSYSSTVYYL